MYWYILFNPEEQIMTCYNTDYPEKYIRQIREECYPDSSSNRMKTVQFQTILEHGGVNKFFVVVCNDKPEECKWVCRWFWYGDMPDTIEWVNNHLDWRLVSTPKQTTKKNSIINYPTKG